MSNIREVHVYNCNNIEKGTLSLHLNRLNVKYGINGTGKSTIAKALEYSINNDVELLKQLTPFKYKNDHDERRRPRVEGLEGFTNVAIFDERYVEQYVYKPDELLANSFEVFIKTSDYDQSIEEINQLISGIGETFQKDPELESLLEVLGDFVDSFGKLTRKGEVSKSSRVYKGLGAGVQIQNIPESLLAYAPYLRKSEKGTNVRWLKWQSGGKSFLDIKSQCPYCTASIEDTHEMIVELSSIYDSKEVEHSNAVLDLFEAVMPYFSQQANEHISKIADDMTNMEESLEYLVKLYSQAKELREKLVAIKDLNPSTLQDVEKIAQAIKEYKINLSTFPDFESEPTRGKVEAINASLDGVLEKAGHLQGRVNQHKNLIRRTIDAYDQQINDFLHCAGYKYCVLIEEDPEKEFRLLLKHQDSEEEIKAPKTHLSFGERNALALVLFMYSALQIKDCDLIMLDDPVSSFDGNKQFAVLNMLFTGENCFRNQTVLVLTHEFNFVIDSIYIMCGKIEPGPKASFLSTDREGILTEKTITRSDIRSAVEIAKYNVENASNQICRLVFLRRLLEIQGSKDEAWQLLSNVFKKRKVPLFIAAGCEDRPMTAEEIERGTAQIRDCIADFNYQAAVDLAKDDQKLLEAYNATNSDYEKLQLYRVMINENNSNDVVRKFVNETFHAENDYLFQLDPNTYNGVAHHVIDICTAELEEVFGRLVSV